MRSRLVFAAWLVVAVLFSIRGGLAERPLTADNQLYFYLAERAASGVPPHLSHVDSKNQLPSLLSAAGIRGSRAVGGDDVVATRVVSIAFGALSLAMLAELATLLAGVAEAGVVAAVSLMAARGFFVHAAMGNNSKVFLVAFLMLAHLAMAKPRRDDRRARRLDFVAGFAAGSAFLCWQPGLLVVAAVAFEALVAREGGWRRCARILVAAAAPVIVYASWFALHGALDEHVHQAYVMTLGSVHEVRSLASSLHFVFTEVGGPLGALRPVPMTFPLLVALVVVGAAVSPRRVTAALRERGGLLSTLLTGVGAAVFTIYDHQGVPDLFFPAPYFALSAALLVAAAVRFASRWMPRAVASLPAAAFLVVLMRQISADDEGITLSGPTYTLAEQRAVADVVRLLHEEVGDVWVYGAVHLLGLAHLDNHVPYGLFYDDVLSVLSIDEYLPLREGRMPEVIVHTRGQLPGSPRYLESAYVEVTPPAFAAQGVRAWRRTAPQPAGIGGGDWRAFEAAPVLPAPTALAPKGPRWEKPWVPSDENHRPDASSGARPAAPPGARR